MLNIQNHPGFNLLFKTEKGAVIQDDQAHQFILEFNGKTTRFKVQEFLQFKKSIGDINLADLFFGDGPGVDIQIIHHYGSDHIFVLTLCDLVAIKELLQGTAAMLDLHRILSDRLLPVVF